MIKVVCGIIHQDRKILITRRKPEKSLGGFWEFPGGKVEEGETPQESLKRELLEELGMQVKVGDFIASNVHHYETFSIDLLAYYCEFISATFEMTDHDAYEWINLETANDYNLAEADIPFLKIIAEIKTN